MNQSELIEKVAQATQLNQAAAGQAVKAVVNAILDALVAGDAVRVSGLGIFNVAARPARKGRNPQTGEAVRTSAPERIEQRKAEVADAWRNQTVCTDCAWNDLARSAPENLFRLIKRPGRGASV
jgi:DNA-binding protein HU-beta